MSRQFTIPTILRQIPNAMLRECLEVLGHNDPEIHWEKLKERDYEPISASLDIAPRAVRIEAEIVLRGVYEIACEDGVKAIIEAGLACGKPDLAQELPEGESAYGKAMWTWLRHREVFEKAQKIHRVDDLPWWRKRNGMPESSPKIDAVTLGLLERSICDILRAEGRGKSCTVEHMRRSGTDYIFAFVDDFVQQTLEHDDDGILAPRKYRQTLAVVFAWTADAGSLELNSRLTRDIKEQLEVTFAKVILGQDLDPFEPPPAYDLNCLKDSQFRLPTDPVDQLRAHIRRVRLSAKNSGRRVLIEADDASGDEIYRAISETLDRERAPLSMFNVTLVQICVEFLPLDGRKAGRHSFDVGFPNSCGLRNIRPERLELIQKYLKKWGIDRAGDPLAKCTSRSLVSAQLESA